MSSFLLEFQNLDLSILLYTDHFFFDTIIWNQPQPVSVETVGLKRTRFRVWTDLFFPQKADGIHREN